MDHNPLEVQAARLQENVTRVEAALGKTEKRLEVINKNKMRQINARRKYNGRLSQAQQNIQEHEDLHRDAASAASPQSARQLVAISHRMQVFNRCCHHRATDTIRGWIYEFPHSSRMKRQRLMSAGKDCYYFRDIRFPAP